MHVVLYGDYPARQAPRLRALLDAGFEIVPVPYDTAPDLIRTELAGARLMVANRYGADDPPVPNLRLLQSPSAGMEGIDRAAVPERCTVRAVGGHEIPMAEYVLCALLDWQIGYRALASTVPDGYWTQRQWIKGPVHGELFGKTLGLVGFGRIGREVARRAAAFGIEVHALSHWRSPRPDRGSVSRCYDLAERDQFLAACDFVVVTLPLVTQTRGLVDQDWFAAMKPNAVLVNVARGEVVRADALFESLAAGRIGGAILDVWYRYPDTDDDAVAMADFPFHTLPNVVVTPHGSGRTSEMFDRRWSEIATNIRSAAYSD